MFYISNSSLIAAIKKLHAAGAHESFRNYLVLKAHGLRFGNSDYINVTTKNTTPVIVNLFGVQGLPEKSPFYNPLRNELLSDEAARGIIQTSVKKYLDEATKTKMKWLEGMQGADKGWRIRFSDEYPLSLGRGLAGLAERDDYQITVDTPSFVLWFHRNGKWEEPPSFVHLWEQVVQELNLHQIEIDLLFTKEREFQDEPFVTKQPDWAKLVDFIVNEEEKGSGRDVLTAPTRSLFPTTKIQRIVSSHFNTEQTQEWWAAHDVQREAQDLLEQTRALLLVGAPGTGKTRLAFHLANEITSGNASHLDIIQFHASYAYEDFIEALVPRPDGNSLRFESQRKRFALACEKAKESKHVVIIDEINRADVSKVFGEAFLLIEREYRDEKFAIPFLHKSDERFWIPPDLYLIATLNDIDKSTYDLDFAFRRRFGQVEVKPSADLLEQVLRNAGSTDEDFIRILRAAFNEVQPYYRLGHAYFKYVNERESLIAAYRQVIRPTVAAYLGQYRQDEMQKVDSIFKRVCEVASWEEYINIEE
ncbi:MAG: hypothetical protein B6D41_14355 [Chloroflexi bacterium UTCFX4]|jgi:DNA polymerase III delta prime subunit|nr:MAG: hypothetical protein B6D41_14355 [Chloroflexi bacterium UTCFX4]